MYPAFLGVRITGKESQLGWTEMIRIFDVGGNHNMTWPPTFLVSAATPVRDEQ